MAKRAAQAHSILPRNEPLGPAEVHPRKLDRERLYAEIGGTIIGLTGAAALISFMLK